MTTANIGSMPALSKPEAVRRAIAALGFRAEVPELLAYIEKHFVLVASETPLEDRTADKATSRTEAPLPDRTSPEEQARTAKRGKGR